MNSLFNPQQLAESFPDAARAHMLPEDPHLAPYEALSQRFRDKQLGLGIAKQAGVSLDTAMAVADILGSKSSESFSALGSTPEGRKLVDTYETAHNTALMLFGLVGEVPPDRMDSGLLEQLNHLQPLFHSFERAQLEPRLVLSLEHQPVAWLEDLAAALKASPFNPDEPNPDYKPGDLANTAPPTRKVLRNGGLWMHTEVRNNWDTMTNPANLPPTWQLHVISGTKAPAIKNVTSYGYADEQNEAPSPELNQLLDSLGLPAIPDRSASVQVPVAPARPGGLFQKPPTPLIKPDIHPSPEAYVTYQLGNVMRKEPTVDYTGWSWLQSELPSGRAPVGRWGPDVGQVRLSYSGVGYRGANLGVRPAGRGQGL